MNFLQRYNSAIRHETGRRVDLHILGQTILAVSAGVLLASQLEMYVGILLIAGLLLMLPLLAKTLADKPKRKKRR